MQWAGTTSNTSPKVRRTPPEFLKPSEVMESKIVGLGTLRTVIQAVPA